MAQTVQPPTRLYWLDGLRGLAALQVVALHYISAFLPAVTSFFPRPLPEFWRDGLLTTPLTFLYDGSAAVFLFFIMSGVALTHAFAAQPFAVPRSVARRIIRLGVPMAAATLLGAALIAALPDSQAAMAVQAGIVSHHQVGPGPMSLALALHQILFEGLLAGFSDYSLLPHAIIAAANVDSSQHAINAPLWTLHLEFCGSLLVMGLVAARAAMSRNGYRALCAVLGAWFVLSPLGLFVLGHAVAGALHDQPTRASRRTAQPAGWLCLAAGVALCGAPLLPPITVLWRLLPCPPIGVQGDSLTLQKMLGAVLVFGGIAILPGVQRQLTRTVPRWFGKISFSLYLTHYPLLYTGVAASFVCLIVPLGYGPAACLCMAAGIALSVGLAVVFERRVDRPAIQLSRKFGAQTSRQPDPARLPALSH